MSVRKCPFTLVRLTFRTTPAFLVISRSPPSEFPPSRSLAGPYGLWGNKTFHIAIKNHRVTIPFSSAIEHQGLQPREKSSTRENI